ncbi:malate dehydrogenase-like isoform X2 [Pieris brassicae]|uniref:malate dehydrogenase-like isoform X2 n=1 Tax=Pieris brassicae TaxID=7116 RepID=UPI001E65F643|nr:malate dehydrogenase-like isoform X2 [Pieris brassicae]
MFRFLRLLNSQAPVIICKANWQNFVKSDALALIEKQCEMYCPKPRFPPRKVAVVGAGTDVGRVASLFLKQQKVIKTLALYDNQPEHNVCGVANDLAHIDTSSEIEAYQGKMFLKDALHTLKVAGVYDKRKVLGVNAINAMRANQLFCSITGADPSKNQTPVICGTGRCTRVPVFSAAKAGNFPQTQVDCLTRLVREADEIICKVKSNREQGHLSIGFSTARFVINIMRGLFEGPTFIDSALVEQGDPGKCYGMPICATPVTVGKNGVAGYAVPNLNDFEKRLLEDSKCDLEDMLNLGRCYAVGDEYYLHPQKTCPCIEWRPCQVCEPKRIRQK